MSKSTKWLLGILIALILIALGILLGYYLPKKLAEKNSSNNSTGTTSTTSNDDLATNNPNEQAQNGAGWKIFKNSHGYLIEYPDGATVENASPSEGEKDKPATNAYCVKISTNYVWTIIASRDIPDNILCLKTGLGTEWQNGPDETITAAGQTYTAKGMIFQSASLGTYSDDYTVTTLSGERIGYGIGISNNDNTMTKAQAKDLVHKIVASFSPAE